MMVLKTPRILLIVSRAVQVFCSILVLAAGVFSVVKFGIRQQEEVLIVKDGSTSVNIDYNSLPDERGDWRPVLLIALSSASLLIFPLLAILRRRRTSVAIEVVLLCLWCSFMTLYIPTITGPFEPSCRHPNPPFEFLDDHTRETTAIGIDIGRNSSQTPIPSNGTNDPGKINSTIHTYCIMSQVGVAAGVIVIVFTFLSILLLLLLSYQATDYLIERRALELLQHHSLPSMVQQSISPISNAYQSIANSIPPLRSAGRSPLDEESGHYHSLHHNISSLHADAITPLGSDVRHSAAALYAHQQQPFPREKSPSHTQSIYQSTMTTTNTETTTTHTATVSAPDTGIASKSQPERSNHDRLQSEAPAAGRPLQLQGWVTSGFEVDKRL
ncbi:hypothetical protein DRE_03403 [Drechslerella stenobrocha 248]|uniref:Uncharacterized protein n=1 Tax=Drechslerella stenobrocha 248 TaxID=1043628 RepID=W7HUT4_9PEZI|nr:hypothetical protein DRE_03403 [Drechslerella stenobrocha 248]